MIFLFGLIFLGMLIYSMIIIINENKNGMSKKRLERICKKAKGGGRLERFCKNAKGLEVKEHKASDLEVKEHKTNDLEVKDPEFTGEKKQLFKVTLEGENVVVKSNNRTLFHKKRI